MRRSKCSSRDGETVTPGTALMRITGNARALLTAERSALNTVQHLSGIATMTRAYVDAMGGRATLLDTRKTIPGLRALEKYATRMGGATNYRMGLWDAVMIKDNHVAVAGGVGRRWRARRRPASRGSSARSTGSTRSSRRSSAGATHLLLDNMAPAMLAEAVALVAGRARPRLRAGCGSTPSARSPRAAWITSRSAG